ncbi:MAG: hypothetical protein JO031_01115 [Ktedonobacteraceae bacterium]|nr:hypothetical protein [Ktedonobacteraceae bacterium]
MECSEPGALRDEELIAYLAGEMVRPAVVEHLAHCQRCSLQLARYRRIELELLSKLYRWDCPPNQILGEYQMGMLSQAQATAVKNHLRTCVLCAAEVTTLTEFLANDPFLVEPIPLVQKAASVSAASNNHHPAQEGVRLIAPGILNELREQLPGKSVVDHVRRIAAILLPQQPRLAYQRTASSQPALWPRRYAAEDVTISVQVERDPSHKDALQLIGLVARKGTAVGTLQGSSVQLSTLGESEKTTYTQTVDELGNFVFSALAPANYALDLQLSEGIVGIDQLFVTIQE